MRLGGAAAVAFDAGPGDVRYVVAKLVDVPGAVNGDQVKVHLDLDVAFTPRGELGPDRSGGDRGDERSDGGRDDGRGRGDEEGSRNDRSGPRSRRTEFGSPGPLDRTFDDAQD